MSVLQPDILGEAEDAAGKRAPWQEMRDAIDVDAKQGLGFYGPMIDWFAGKHGTSRDDCTTTDALDQKYPVGLEQWLPPAQRADVRLHREVARRRAEKAKYVGFATQERADAYEVAHWAAVPAPKQPFHFNLPFLPGKWLGKLIAAVFAQFKRIPCK